MSEIDFLALDVETANADLSSICQIGVVTFGGGEVVNRWGTLINPQDYFDGMNVSIHGITADAVASAPTYVAIDPVLREMFSGKIVVTHTAFDQASLRKCAAKYAVPELDCIWLDSARVARRAWEQFRQSGYGLSNLALEFDIQYRAHDAVEDARVCGEVVIRAIKDTGIPLQDWLRLAYQRTRCNGVSSSVAMAGNPDGPLAGNTIVFTGALSMKRAEAAKKAADAGCNVADGVNRDTTLLVVGDQDVRVLGGKEKSSKHLKAEALILKGQDIRILTESDFLAMISV